MLKEINLVGRENCYRVVSGPPAFKSTYMSLSKDALLLLAHIKIRDPAEDCTKTQVMDLTWSKGVKRILPEKVKPEPGLKR